MTNRDLRPVIEIGFGAGPTEPFPVWTDISDFVWGAGSGPELAVTRGRTGERAQVQPGTATFTLDNTDGRFDPDNEGSPHWPGVVDGVPVRVRAASNARTERVWRGWVESWPQVDAGSSRIVEIDCLDVIGLIAQGDAPATAFDAEARRLDEQPDQWWRPGADGWIDRVGGLAARHTSALSKMETSVVDGDESWGQEDPDGHGLAPRVQEGADGWTVISAMVRFPADRPHDELLDVRIPTVICWQPAAYSGQVFDRLRLTASGGQVSAAVTVRARDGSGVRTAASWSTAPDVDSDMVAVELHDGRAHAVTVAMRAGHPNSTHCHLWVDGQAVRMHLTDWNQGPASVPIHGSDSTLRIGVGAATSVFNGTPYQGVIDHLMIWGDHPGTVGAIEADAKRLADAARLAWAGQRLDERMRSILVGVDTADLIGAMELSGIVTRQGFRQSAPLELLQKIEDTEQGRVWVDRWGEIRFFSRNWPSRAQSSLVRAWFSDSPADLADGASPMLADQLRMSKDPRQTTNVAQVTSEHGRMQTVEDADSIAKRGRRNPVHLSGLLHPSDRQSRAIAQFIIATSSEPRWRVDSLSFRAEDSSTLARYAQVVEEGDLVRVTRSGRDVFGHVVGVQHHVDQWGWQVTLSLDSTRAETEFWRADLSEADGPDRAGF